MKTLGLFILTTLFLNSGLAHAQIQQPSEYQIVGSGMEDRKTGETLAIACLNKECNRLQHLYVNADTGELKFVGNVYQVVQEGTADAEQIKAELNHIHRLYRDQVRENRMFSMPGVYALGGATVFGGIVSSGAAGIAFVTSPVGAIAFFGLVGMNVFIAYSNRALNFNADHLSKIFLDQKGWNWAERPKLVSHHSFKRYLKNI